MVNFLKWRWGKRAWFFFSSTLWVFGCGLKGMGVKKKIQIGGRLVRIGVCDAFPHSLKDSNANSKMKIVEEGVGVCSLFCSILGGRRVC